MNRNQLPKEVPNSNNFFAAWNKIIQWMQGNTLYSSSDILVNQTMKGTSLTLVKRPSATQSITASIVGTTTTQSIQNSQFVCTGQDGGDYILAKSLPNGGTVAQALASSASYYIAKPYKIRNSITTEYINGVTHSYTYSPPLNDSSSYYTRNDVYGSLSEQQTITPQYLIGDIIVAAPVNGTIPGYISVIATGSIANGGKSYTVGDYLYPVIGALGVYPATMSVTSVGVSGSLTSFAIVNCGKYTYATNPLPTLPTTNGSGVSASINLIYSSPLEDLNVDGRAWGH
jgi:hypothetical protein